MLILLLYRMLSVLLLLILTCTLPSCTMQSPAFFDPPERDAAFPASMVSVQVPSAGVLMLGNMLVAAGEGPHPTVLVLHGFPGNENNYDLAHALRRAGWNALVFHYRGAWGSPGDFSFGHVLEDVEAAVDYLTDPVTVAALRIDTEQLYAVGHSMGGFAALHIAARDARVRGVASLAGFNFGAFTQTIRDDEVAIADTEDAFEDALGPLQGCTAGALVAEMIDHTEAWNLLDRVRDLSGKPVLLVGGAADEVAPVALHHLPLVGAFRAADHSGLTTFVLEDDHAFSSSRLRLTRRLVQWLHTAISEAA